MHPAKIGPYQIERKIGAGGMGTVYQGRHVETGELAAVKVLPASMAREEGFVARFNREIEAVQKLSNPHIVGFQESGVENETYWYAMEFVDGETLTARLRRDGKLGWKEAVRISLQICIALKAAHDMGIVHRDLKPSNLMLDKDGNVKLTDFGVAQVFAASRLTVTGGIIGTAEYMSPEQAQGRRATKKSDLYSLGAVMYAMLTGRPPFSGKSTVDVIQKQRFGQFDRPRMYVDDLPYWLDELVCQLLEKNPDDRLADAYVLSRRLKEIEKKVELSQSGHTLGHETSGSYDGDAPTVSAELMATHAEEGFGGPGPGTLMRDLVRAEIELASEGGRFSRLVNSTWFLVTMLLLLIAGGVWWFRTPALSPEEQFEAGQEIMARGEGPEWLKARDEYFEPLMQEDPERWRDRVAPFLERIEFYALQESVRPSPLRRERNETDEPRRFLRLARHYRDVGDRAAATRVLESLCLLLQYHQNEQATLELARQMLAELEDPGENQETLRPFIAASLAEAERLKQAGESTAARQILRSIVSL
ncbi:MAG: serine/threonine protein kinase, partial [Planctomycetaceae bacterium]|nr:serine/threonine protein kinase [Planctomycetaceae bacterium]